MNFQKVAFGNGQFLNLLGVALFFAQVQMLKMLQLNRTISVLSATLRHGAEDLGHLAVILIVYLTAFAVIALHLFARELTEFRDVKHVYISLLSTMLGKFDYSSWVSSSGLAGNLFFITYMLVMFFLMINVFVLIIDEANHIVQENEGAVADEDMKLLEHIIRKLKSFIGLNDTDLEPEDILPGK